MTSKRQNMTTNRHKTTKKHTKWLKGDTKWPHKRHNDQKINKMTSRHTKRPHRD